jgi:hypothetical protein
MTRDDSGGRGDDLLEELLALARRSEPAPASVVSAALDAFKWRGVAQAIVGLEFDSALDDDRLARVRDAGAERRLRFVGAEQTVEVTLVDNNRRLAGRVDPPQPGSMVMRHPDGATASAPLDESGRFFFDTVRRGPVSLLSVRADGTNGDFETEWVTI